MSNQKATGEFSKVRKLISVLEKCNGKSKIGGSEALISPRAAKVFAAVGLVFLTAALAAAAYFAEPLISPYISMQDFTKVLMMILLMLSLVLSVKNIVTVLYTADDLPVLLPMPFSAGQIVIAKLTVTLKFPVVLSVILINASFFGFGLRAGMGAAFNIGTVLEVSGSSERYTDQRELFRVRLTCGNGRGVLHRHGAFKRPYSRDQSCDRRAADSRDLQMLRLYPKSRYHGSDRRYPDARADSRIFDRQQHSQQQ